MKDKKFAAISLFIYYFHFFKINYYSASLSIESILKKIQPYNDAIVIAVVLKHIYLMYTYFFYII